MEGETITHFLAQLKAQAQLCEFSIPCITCTYNVSDVTDMVSGQLVAGVANTDYQGKVPADAAILTSLQLKFDKLISLESTHRPCPHKKANINKVNVHTTTRTSAR